MVFALPLLYTMEVWTVSAALHPGRLLIYVAATFALLLLYNRFAGLREDAGWGEVMIDSVEEMGLGLLLAAGVLWLTGRIGEGADLPELTGKVVMEGMTVAIGVSVGTAQLGGAADGDEGVAGEDGNDGVRYLPQAAISLCGAVLFTANVAPTEEIRVIAVEADPLKLLLLALVSLVCATVVLHFSGMHGTDRLVARDTIALRIRGVVTCYGIALLAAAGCLAMFGSLDGLPWRLQLAMAVVAGLPGVLGASAGRLLLQAGTGGKHE